MLSPAEGGEPGGYPPGLRAKLMAAVRPEFRASVLVIDPYDPVYGNCPCLVAACGRAARLHDLCEGHYQRWHTRGRPDKPTFAASAAARMRARGPGSR